MNLIVKFIEFYNYFKSAIDPLLGLFLGAVLTYVITFSQVKKNNRFIILKETKQELMASMDNLHKEINIINMKSNDFYRYINAREYSNIKILLDEILFIYNETLQIKNSLICNFELLNSIYKDYLGKTELSNIILKTDMYLEYYYEKMYSKMTSPTFYQENFVSDAEYIDAIDNYRLALQRDDFKNHFQSLADCHVGKVVEFINSKLAKLVK